MLNKRDSRKCGGCPGSLKRGSRRIPLPTCRRPHRRPRGLPLRGSCSFTRTVKCTAPPILPATSFASGLIKARVTERDAALIPTITSVRPSDRRCAHDRFRHPAGATAGDRVGDIPIVRMARLSSAAALSDSPIGTCLIGGSATRSERKSTTSTECPTANSCVPQHKNCGTGPLVDTVRNRVRWSAVTARAQRACGSA
jgi:hypothetical protein